MTISLPILSQSCENDSNMITLYGYSTKLILLLYGIGKNILFFNLRIERMGSGITGLRSEITFLT